MKIIFYAILKEYFEPAIQIEENMQSVETLNAYLLQLNPDAGPILKSCRYAINDRFVDLNFQLNADDSIHIIPPSSGG